MYNKEDEFSVIVRELIENSEVQKMKDYLQHYDISCFVHCYDVAYYSYLICKKYNLDYKSAARAGMLHDLFLYDWRVKQANRKRFHGYRHPRIALTNSLNLFSLNEIEQNCILRHMWPLTIIPPKYKEGYVISFVDKYCTLMEAFNYYKGNLRLKKLYRYSYVFLSMLVIRIF